MNSFVTSYELCRYILWTLVTSCELFCYILWITLLLHLVHALVTSRLDYCNSLLCGLPNNTMHHAATSMGQNYVARIITRSKKYDHITPVLQRLYWLPVHLRPTYKVLLLTYCALNGVAPDYLSELFNYRHVNRTNFDLPRSRPFCSYRPHRLSPTVITVSPSARQFYGTICRLWSGPPQQWHFKHF